MDSKKSRPNCERIALEPQRRRGVLRVASLMEAAAAVIAERGYESATMAESLFTRRARTGSLRFFPNKGPGGCLRCTVTGDLSTWLLGRSNAGRYRQRSTIWADSG